jgi:type IV pilus assembly protein PilV
MAAQRVSQRGFTMIEVMVAIVLMAIVVTGVVGLFAIESRASQTSRHTTEASVLAEDKMEFLRTQVAPATGSETGLTESGQAGGAFSRSWAVTTNTTYIDYSVTVTWNEDAIAKVVTLRSRRGL